MMRSRRARRLYSTIIKKSRGHRLADLRRAAELGIVELDIVGRRYRRALGRIDRVLEGDADEELAAQALYQRGDILSRLGRVRESLAAYQLAVHDYPETAYAAEAALAGARLAYNTRSMALARALADWMVERGGSGESVATLSGDGAAKAGDAARGLRDEALWLRAWIERRNGSMPAVMDSYLAQIDATGRLADAALYWRARLALDAGQLADAEVFADLLVARKPTSFYALAASDLVARMSPGCAVRIEVPEVGTNAAVPPRTEPRDLLGAVVLFEHGLQSEARQIVRLLPGTTLSGADRLAAAWIYGRCGDVHRATILTRRLVEGEDALDPTLLGLAFPRPFSDIVETAEADHGVPASLIYAVIRQESAFNPNAVSPRYARGLMQMIRPTAKRMAAEAELKRFRQKQLYDPEISIRLGTTYLASLLTQFGGNLAAAVAAYHAGEHNVARWLKSRGHMNADEFIEEIPFTTTREYVKKVLSAYGVYTLLYDDRATWAMPLEIASFTEAAAARTALR
jgi:soluble lytic murein transglycosylase